MRSIPFKEHDLFFGTSIIILQAKTIPLFHYLTPGITSVLTLQIIQKRISSIQWHKGRILPMNFISFISLLLKMWRRSKIGQDLMLNIQMLDGPLNGAEWGGQFSRKYGKEVNCSRSFGQKSQCYFAIVLWKI